MFMIICQQKPMSYTLKHFYFPTTIITHRLLQLDANAIGAKPGELRP